MTNSQSAGVEITAANPTIRLVESEDGYHVSAVPSTGFAAKLGKLALVLFCLVFLGMGIVVWFLPDSVFSGDPQVLKIIVTVVTWVIFAPLLYFNFINTTTMQADVDLTKQMLHQVFLNKNGDETKRRSFAFADIADLELHANGNVVEAGHHTLEYGQIFLRLSASKGVSLVWGPLKELEPVRSRMRQDVLGRVG